MSIKSAAEFEGLKRIGKIVRSALDTMARAAQPGVSTAELSVIGERVLQALIAMGSGRERLLSDGWTIATEDGGWAAHYEHTLVITQDKPILLTATG